MHRNLVYFVGYLVFLLVVFCAVAEQAEVKCEDLKSCKSCTGKTECSWYSCTTTNFTCANSKETMIKFGSQNCTIVEACNETDPSVISSSAKISSASSNLTKSSTKVPVFISSVQSSPVASLPVVSSIKKTSVVAPTTVVVTTTPLPPKPLGPTSATEGRRFDGASFIGGMILSAGLILLGYFGWQWYQTRSKSYHSL